MRGPLSLGITPQVPGPEATAPIETHPECGRSIPLAEQMAVTFCDVGQADTTIVEVATITIVVDAGHWQRSDVDDCLDGAGVTQIDVLALTHPDAEHIGQAVDVLDAYGVTQV